MSRLLTLFQRASKRGGLVLALLFCATLAFSSGCSTDYQNCPDCPGSPALIPGNFVLSGIDGNLLPYNPPNTNVTILSGTCVTTADEKFTMSITTTTGKDTVTTVSTGTVLAFNKGQVTFAFPVAGEQAAALITGNGFALTYSGMAFQFDRQG
jgi:hypothetical protein